MVGFFNFKKSQSQASGSAGTPSAGSSESVTVTQTTTSTPPQQTGGTYNGIGAPPGGQSYNGIGAPPPPTAPETTGVAITQTTTTQHGAQAPPMTGNQSQVSYSQTNTAGTKQTSVAASAAPQTGVLSSNMNSEKRGELDVMTHLTQRSNRVFFAANNKAKELQNVYLDTEHLLHGLITDGEIYKLLVELKIQPQAVEQELGKIYKKEQNTAPPQNSPRTKRVIDNSLIIARKLGFEFISPEHLLLALYEEREGVGSQILVKQGLKKEDLNKKLLGKKEGLEKEQKTQEQAKKGVMEQFTVDLTAKAAQGLLDPVVERSEVIERVIHILSRRTKNNPALVGEAGVGKTAVVEGLAEKIVAKQVPETLLDKRILELDLMGILAGASHRGEFEERMKNLIEDLKNSQGKIILFIDEIHTIVGAGSSGEGSIDASNFLKPALARGEIQLIGATTLTEYRKYIEKDPALERRFQPVVVPEPTEEQAIKMLKSTRDKYEAFHRVKIPDEVVESAVKLSKRYVGDRFLPDKAVDLMDEAASAVRLPLISLPEVIKSLEDRVSQLNQEKQEAEKARDRVKVRILNSKIAEIQTDLKNKQDEFNVKKGQSTAAVTTEIIKDIVSRWTGIPVAKITGSEMERLANLEKIMHERMIGQERAVTSVAQAVRRGRAGLKSTQRPIGSFVFLGPTGVGKTELAKTLADILFGQEEAMLRFDMTEYMEKHEVAKLLGAPPGYVGYEEGGKLTEAVRRKPYSVVLFDEVEKAHPDIFNILLQILDDGRLTDNKGHVISFKNTVVICTSNIGSTVIQDELLKSGKAEVEEPPVLSTYAFSPRGKEILTIGSKFFERYGKDANVDQQGAEKKTQEESLKPTTYAFSPRGREIVTVGNAYYERDIKPDLSGTAGQKQDNKITWTNSTLNDYFAGQKIEGADDKTKFPTDQLDTHTISSKGVEMVTKDEHLYTRNSTTSKVWQHSNLIEYFKDQVVINALPDAPDEQLPTVKLQTHALSPDEMEIVSFKNRFWGRKEGTTDWQTGLLKDYFQDQTIENAEFPSEIWNAHTFTPTGREIIVSGEFVWYREPGQPSWKKVTAVEYFGNDRPGKKEEKTQEPQKQVKHSEVEIGKWKSGMLFDYFEGQQVDGAKDEKADKKDKDGSADFPVQGFETHTISPKGMEMITKGNMVFMRDSTTAKVWKTTTLLDYFKDQTVVNALPDAPEEQLPTAKLKTHTYTTDGMEVVNYKDRFWTRKDGEKKWETGTLKDYFIDQTLAPAPPADGKKTGPIKVHALPITHWDIHTYTPQGKEIVIVSEDVWVREKDATVWTQITLNEFFGDDFPLEKELEEKKKVESESDAKKYDVIKEKVMFELRKFFRPELINRFDEVIFFEPLKFSHMTLIVKLQLKAVSKLLLEQDMDFAYTDAAIKEVVRAGFDPVFGARPLRRAIQRLIENPISTLIIERKAQAGDTILADFDGENFVFNVQREEMVDVDKKQDKKIHRFLCNVCANKYNTEVKPNATTICSKCAATNVQEIVEDSEENMEEFNKQDKQETPPQAPMKSEATPDSGGQQMQPAK